MRTSPPLALALAVVLTACGVESPTAPGGDPAFAPAPQMSHHAAAEYFLFGHHNASSNMWKVATDGTATVDVIGPTTFNTNASGMGTSRAPTPVAGGVTYPAGTHFGLLEIGGGPENWVYVIDTSDGHAVPIVRTSRDIRGRGIDFGPDGRTLYVIEQSPGELSTVDLVTGEVRRVASTVGSTSLEWDPVSEKFIAIVGSGDVYQVSHVDGSATKISDLAISSVCTVTRSPDGMWYTFGGNTMYSFDPLTGAKVGLGSRSGLSTVCGTAFAPVRVINQPPTADAGGPYFGDEGSSITFAGTGSDPEGGELEYSWDFGDGGTASGATVTHAYGDNALFVVTLTVTDPEGISVTVPTFADVSNVAPAVDAGADAEVELGDPFVLAGSFADPGFHDTWSWTVEWGDGTVDSGSGVPGPLAPAHDYGAAGEYVVTLTVTDDDGASGADRAVVTVVGVVDVLIDVKPGSFPNSIGRNKNGVLPVAILTTEDFDAATVLVETVTLGDEDGADTGVIVKKNGSFQASLEDVDGDGDVDLILHFDVPALFANGDLTFDSTQLVLLGTTADGRDIRGVDSVRMVGNGK